MVQQRICASMSIARILVSEEKLVNLFYKCGLNENNARLHQCFNNDCRENVVTPFALRKASVQPTSWQPVSIL